MWSTGSGFIRPIEAFGSQQIIPEFDAKIQIHLRNSACTTHKTLEVFVQTLPSGVATLKDFAEVGKKISIQASPVKKAELIVDDILNPQTADGFCLHERCVVVMTLDLIVRLIIDVHTQRFLAYHLHTIRHSYGRVIIQKEGAAAARNRTAAHGNFYTFHVCLFEWQDTEIEQNNQISAYCILFKFNVLHGACTL
jgi:hypothetical protein